MKVYVVQKHWSHEVIETDKGGSEVPILYYVNHNKNVSCNLMTSSIIVPLHSGESQCEENNKSAGQIKG